MSEEDSRVKCLGWTGQPPRGVQCPPSLSYPKPPSTIDLLFLAWNPPGDTHFWNSPGDNLRENLQWIFRQLGWPEDRDVTEIFRERQYFLVHAVRCWRTAKFDWGIAGLIETCAQNSLRGDLERLRPKAVCALGKLPHQALRVLWPGEIPETVAYGRGWMGTAGGAKILITCFPNTYVNPARGMHNRACTREALSKWMPAIRAQSSSAPSISDQLRDLLSQTELSSIAEGFLAAAEAKKTTDILLQSWPLVEILVRRVLKQHRQGHEEQSFHQMCQEISRLALLSEKAVAYLRTVQKLRNAAAHPQSGGGFSEDEAMSIVNMVREIIREGHGRGFW
jgi:hypothetical protein